MKEKGLVEEEQCHFQKRYNFHDILSQWFLFVCNVFQSAIPDRIFHCVEYLPHKPVVQIILITTNTTFYRSSYMATKLKYRLLICSNEYRPVLPHSCWLIILFDTTCGCRNPCFVLIVLGSNNKSTAEMWMGQRTCFIWFLYTYTPWVIFYK